MIERNKLFIALQAAMELIIESKKEELNQMAMDKVKKEGSGGLTEVTVEFPMATALEVVDPCGREAWEAFKRQKPPSRRGCEWCSDMRTVQRGLVKVFKRDRDAEK